METERKLHPGDDTFHLIQLTEREKALLNLFTDLVPSYNMIRSTIARGRFTSEEITRAAIEYVHDCYYEEMDLSDDFGEDLNEAELHSAALPGLFRLLLEFGLDPNAVYENCNLMNTLFLIKNGYCSADALALLLENGGDLNTVVDGERVFDHAEFDIFFDAFELYDRRRYDAEVHFWLVCIGYGAKLTDGRCPVTVIPEEDPLAEDLGVKPFELADLKQHRNYTFGLSHVPSNGESYTIHIFDKRTNWEVARV